MESNGGGGEEYGKRRRQEEEDRFSKLPEPIICLILSFLDTKSAARTTILARAFRNLWKALRVLDFQFGYGPDDENYSAFKRFLDWVLSVRDSDRDPFLLSLASCNVYFFDDVDVGAGTTQFARFVRYALSREAPDLVFCLRYRDPDARYRFSTLFGTNSGKHVESLLLGGVHIDRGFSSFDFQGLETLELNTCLLDFEEFQEVVPFANFPCLSKLVLDGCCGAGFHWYDEGVDSDNDNASQRLKISGTQLLSLEMVGCVVSSIEIDTPNLTSFSLEHYELSCLNFSRLTLPSLDYASLHITDEDEFLTDGNEGRVVRRVNFLFQGLHHATTLVLDSTTIEAMNQISDLFEEMPSPFASLQILKVKGDIPPDNVLVTYFFGENDPTIEYV